LNAAPTGVTACGKSAASEAGAVADTTGAGAGIDSLHARFLAAYDKDDAKAVAETYIEDTRFITEGKLETGRAAMEDGWKRELPSLSDLKLIPIERVIR
jgi:ketosteroid isomerase-like protein